MLPDGASGVDRVLLHGKLAELPWVARAGLKYVSDDFAIGHAYAKVPYGATPDAIGTWPGGHIPYCAQKYNATTNPMGLTSAERTALAATLHELEKITPLHFDVFDCDASNPPSRYVDYLHWSITTYNETVPGIGHSGWTIHLTPSINDPSVWHETGHAVGFMHEQQRKDRSQFVNYYPSCLSNKTKYEGNFTTYTTPDTLTPYDIDSIMEYWSGTFSSSYPSCPTLLFGAPDPSSAPVYGHAPDGTTLRGTTINGGSQWSAEDINATFQLFEPVLGTPEQNDRLGTSMAVGDFDGDGYDDLAVGAMGEQPYSGHGGAVFVYKGTRNGLVPWKVLDEAQFSGVSTKSTDDFGMRVTAGDLNGDGVDDLVVGAPLYGSSYGGAVFAYLGGRGGLKAAAGPITQSNTGAGSSESSDMFGAALAIGKFGGSSTAYLAVGSPWEKPPGATGSRGMVTLLRWNGSGFSFWYNIQATDAGIGIDSGMFGYALAAGDFNYDGWGDLVIGAPADGVGTGNVVVFFGHTGAMVAGIPLTTTNGLATDDRFGESVAVGFDPGANTSVIAVGAPGRGAGRAYKYLPFTWTTPGATIPLINYGELKQSDIPGETGQTGDAFGTSVAVGDVDGDGTVDFLVGAGSKPVNGVALAGEICVFGSSGTNKVLTASNPQVADSFGQSFAIGNFDRGARGVTPNNKNDVAVGLPGRNVGTVTGAGVVNIYKGTSQSFWRQFDQSTSDAP